MLSDQPVAAQYGPVAVRYLPDPDGREYPQLVSQLGSVRSSVPQIATPLAVRDESGRNAIAHVAGMTIDVDIDWRLAEAEPELAAEVLRRAVRRVSD